MGALREAFRAAGIFYDLYESSSKNVTLQIDQIANIAVHQFGIAPASKAAFAKSFSKSVVAAGLARDVGGGEIQLVDESSEGSALESGTASGDDRPRMSVGAGYPAAPDPGTPVFSQPWEFEGGCVRFDLWLDRPLPVDAFKHLESVHAAVQGLVKLLAGSREEPAGFGEEGELPN